MVSAIFNHAAVASKNANRNYFNLLPPQKLSILEAVKIKFLFKYIHWT